MELNQTDKCVLMFSGGRDSTIAAMRLSKKFRHLILVTVISEHLVGVERVYQRIIQLKKYLPKETEWVQVILPKFTIKEQLLNVTCLPCQRAYVIIGSIIAQKGDISNLAMGYSGYQNTWPEQTPYAVEKLRETLKISGIQLHLPVYDIKEKDYALDELTRLGLKKESYEQKCLKQQYNIELGEDILKTEIDKWTAGISEIIKLKNTVTLDIRFHGRISDIGDLSLKTY
ncbi:hypothetical protein FP828_03815 [bacterium]|nr:hypothetical protein [bacterium]